MDREKELCHPACEFTDREEEQEQEQDMIYGKIAYQKRAPKSSCRTGRDRCLAKLVAPCFPNRQTKAKKK